ncbi:MAG: hydroxyquinol 1,2-dioxygenase [Actinoplanes sp.]|jgi:hydroxyquinol 1,2-dioxygenase|nr:hydroxyquinol 1,2-dioxygenase [Actinoplanes sp.]
MAFVTGEEITELAVKRWATANPPRLAELMTGLVRHLHQYVEEVGLTEEELWTGFDWLEAASAFKGGRREIILASLLFGVNAKVIDSSSRCSPRTPATPPGPREVFDAPEVPFGYDISRGIDGEPLYIIGRVVDQDDEPVPNALLFAWLPDTGGLYHEQALRGKYRTRDDGTYCIRAIVPAGYSVPLDGPVGQLLSHTAISPWRPSHIHFLIEEKGFEKVNTELFPEGGDYVDTDAGLITKKALVVPFIEHPSGETPDGGHLDRPYRRADYDFVLQRKS